MTRTPLVSAILIFLNAEAFLEEAIKSVLAQTWNDWELLLVDDGSTDGSTSIARGYAEEHGERIIYLEHHAHMNRGKSTSRNLGLQRARGEYVAFLDADDVWLPAKLAKQADRFRVSRGSHAVRSHSIGAVGQGKSGRDGVVGVGRHPAPGPYLLSCYPAPRHRSGICSVMTRRKAVVEVAGFEESIQKMFEDQTLIAKICLHGSVFVDSGCYDLYRQHPGSSSSQAVNAGTYHPWRPSSSHLAYLEWLASYVERHRGPDDDKLRRKLQQEIWFQRHRLAGDTIGLARLVIEIGGESYLPLPSHGSKAITDKIQTQPLRKIVPSDSPRNRGSWNLSLFGPTMPSMLEQASWYPAERTASTVRSV